MDHEQLEVMRELAWLVHNITECVQSDRLQAYNTEQNMTIQAQELSKTYELLAGNVHTFYYRWYAMAPLSLVSLKC